MSTRLFVSVPLGNGRSVELDGEQARYLGRVLRLATGTRVSLFNGEDGEWQARIVAMTKSTVSLEIEEELANHSESSLLTQLVQGVSRGDRMDFVIQKATELGVRHITPVLTDHGTVRLDEKRADKRRKHWRRVAESACEQCGRTRPPTIDEPLPLNHWFGSGQTTGTRLVLRPGATTAMSEIDTIEGAVCLLIGPEGGFSEREYEDAGIAGFQSVSLGPRILRTETAALAALTLMQARFGDL